MNSKIAVQAKEDDRRWFADHPGEAWRLRDVVPGEFEPEWTPDLDNKTYAYRRGNGQIFRCPLAPQEYETIQAGAVCLFPALIDGIMKWVVRTLKG